MSTIDLISQGVSDSTYLENLKDLFNEDFDNYYIFVAYLRSSGVQLMSDSLSKNAEKVTCYIGIRNGNTSFQGLLELLKLKTKVYVIDIPDKSSIYHSKIYHGHSENTFHYIIGSANLTSGGLFSNIETGVSLKLDKRDASDIKFIEQFQSSYFKFEDNYPDNVKLIENESDIRMLLDEGLIVDEADTFIKVAGKTTVKSSNTTPNFFKNRVLPTKQSSISPSTTMKGRIVGTSGLGIFVWKCTNLSARDLNIPPKESPANVTGSIGLKKGVMPYTFDHRVEFRHNIFSGLTWVQDPKKAHIERAQANFEIIIKNISYGTYNLIITHNNDVNSKTYAQSNFVTHLRWGKVVKQLIRNHTLLGLDLEMYKVNNKTFQLLII